MRHLTLSRGYMAGHEPRLHFGLGDHDLVTKLEIRWPGGDTQSFTDLRPDQLLRIQQISGERLEILQGSFYSAIYRLERRGCIKGEWGESENNRRAKYYQLTRAGRRRLGEEKENWAQVVVAITRLLEAS